MAPSRLFLLYRQLPILAESVSTDCWAWTATIMLHSHPSIAAMERKVTGPFQSLKGKFLSNLVGWPYPTRSFSVTHWMTRRSCKQTFRGWMWIGPSTCSGHSCRNFHKSIRANTYCMNLIDPVLIKIFLLLLFSFRLIYRVYLASP